MSKVPELFGSMVFNEDAMTQYVSRTAMKAWKDCLQSGLLILTAKTLLRLLPPLNITREELDKGLSILESVLERIEDQ